MLGIFFALLNCRGIAQTFAVPAQDSHNPWGSWWGLASRSPSEWVEWGELEISWNCFEFGFEGGWGVKNFVEMKVSSSLKFWVPKISWLKRPQKILCRRFLPNLVISFLNLFLGLGLWEGEELSRWIVDEGSGCSEGVGGSEQSNCWVDGSEMEFDRRGLWWSELMCRVLTPEKLFPF